MCSFSHLFIHSFILNRPRSCIGPSYFDQVRYMFHLHMNSIIPPHFVGVLCTTSQQEPPSRDNVLAHLHDYLASSSLQCRKPKDRAIEPSIPGENHISRARGRTRQQHRDTGHRFAGGVVVKGHGFRNAFFFHCFFAFSLRYECNLKHTKGPRRKTVSFRHQPRRVLPPPMIVRRC